MTICATCGRPLRQSPGVTEKHGYTLCDDSQTVIAPDGRRLQLMRQGFKAVAALIIAPGMALSRERMFDAIYWDVHECDWPESSRTIDVLMVRLRRLLPAIGLQVRTIYGKGWQLVDVESGDEA